MKKLIQMTDFVLQEHNKFGELPYKELEKEYDYALTLIAKFRNYADFLKQPLTLGMFIPCDLDGNVLEEPKCECETEYDREGCYEKCYEYINAKNRVLFEGFRQNIVNSIGSFEIINESGFQVFAYKSVLKYFLWLGCPEERTVESALKFHEFTLTPTAIKQIT